MQVQPYLFFDGRCEEAIGFYQRTLGAQLDMLMRYKESPETPPPGMVPPNFDDKVMHASFRIGDSVVMASDGCTSDAGPHFRGFSLSITAPDEAAARRMFDALGDGGRITMPLGKTFWSPCFGMLSDRYGIDWMIGVMPS